MKRIKYNSLTREIEIYTQEKKSIKKFLTDKKIFFDIFGMGMLTIMSIIIAWVGINIDERSRQIAQKELEILDNNREAIFSIQYENIPDEGIYKYTIYNIGGTISGSWLYAESFFDININDDTYGQKKYRIYFEGCNHYENNYLAAYFNEETKSFSFNSDFNSKIDEFRLKLQDNIVDKLTCGSVYIYRKNRINIDYINFENQSKHTVYEIIRDSLMSVNSNYEEDNKYELLDITIRNFDDQDLENVMSRINIKQ